MAKRSKKPAKKAKARKTQARKGISLKKRQILAGHVITNAKFREDFLLDPKAAAARIGIKLSNADQRDALAQVDVFRAAAQAAEQAIRAKTATIAEPHGGIATGYILD